VAHDWLGWAGDQLDTIRAAGRFRATRPFDALGPAGTLDGREVVSFASNDYLGLAAHPTVIAAAHDAIDRWGTGATASRLIVGNRPVHDELEAELAAWKGTDRAVVFPTGFAANLGVLATIGGTDTTVFSDELNHASIIDGARLSRSAVRIYRHNDLDHLGALMDDEAKSGRRLVVVADSVFSMDGDHAPVDQLAHLCAAHGALLMLDEAHAVLGPAAPPPTDGRVKGAVTIRVGTLSKALGALGGFAAVPAPIADLLVNRARPYIFTTGLSPADSAAALAAVRIVRSADGDVLLERLRTLIDRVAAGHPSPIVPIVLGDEESALRSAAALLERGIFIPAIRPPTVPPGTSRLRLTLSAGHTDEMIDALVAALGELGLR
jgi:8-amino-7-oxononanoate synthase